MGEGKKMLKTEKRLAKRSGETIQTIFAREKHEMTRKGRLPIHAGLVRVFGG
jgi:hypothetical protein